MLHPVQHFHMMYSAYKLNKQGDNIQPSHTPFPILNQSVIPRLVLTVAWQIDGGKNSNSDRSSQALPKHKLAPKKKKKVMVTGDLLPVRSTTAFWILANHYIWEVCSVNQWDAPKLQCLQQTLVNRKDAILLHDNTWPHVAQPILRKLNKLIYEIVPHLPYSPDLSPTDYHFFKHLDNFLQKKCFHNQ